MVAAVTVERRACTEWATPLYLLSSDAIHGTVPVFGIRKQGTIWFSNTPCVQMA